MKRTLSRAGPVALTLLACLYLVGPVLWLAGAALSTDTEFAVHSLYPRTPVIRNFAAYVSPPPQARDVGSARDTALVLGLETARSFLPAMLSSFLVGLVVVAVNLVLGSVAAYALARVASPWSEPLLLFYLVSRSIPAVAIMIPMYLLLRGWGLLDHPLAVVLAHSTFTLPFTIWMLKGYFHTVPLDLERAARVDGCSQAKALLRVFLPVTTPGLVAAGIFSFVFSLGEFLYALLFTTRFARTAPVVLSDFISEVEIPFPLVAAGGILAVVLPVVLAFAFQRLLVRGIGGAVTG